MITKAMRIVTAHFAAMRVNHPRMENRHPVTTITLTPRWVQIVFEIGLKQDVPVSMSAIAAADDNAKVMSRINGTLRGPVTEIFQDLIPQLRPCTRREAYERIMNNPRLAATCFREFRAQPQLFKTLMVSPEQQPVTSDDQPLSCGRTLAQIIALVVRAIAKRYFRAKLGVLRRVAAPKKRSLFEIAFGMFRPSPPPAPVRRDVTRADALYNAMRDSLLYEWQVVLIPHYVQLPVSLVREMGPRILNYRKADQIQRLAEEGKAPLADPMFDEPVPTQPAAGPTPGPGAGPGPAAPAPARPKRPTGALASRLDTMWTISRSLNLPELFGCDEREMRHLIAAANGVGRPALAALTSAGLRPSTTTVAACTIVQQIGHTRLMTLLGPSPSPAFLQRLTQLVRDYDLQAQTSPKTIKQAMERILGQMKSLIREE